MTFKIAIVKYDCDSPGGLATPWQTSFSHASDDCDPSTDLSDDWLTSLITSDQAHIDCRRLRPSCSLFNPTAIIGTERCNMAPIFRQTKMKVLTNNKLCFFFLIQTHDQTKTHVQDTIFFLTENYEIFDRQIMPFFFSYVPMIKEKSMYKV